jgi:hypothetical protein
MRTGRCLVGLSIVLRVEQVNRKYKEGKRRVVVRVAFLKQKRKKERREKSVGNRLSYECWAGFENWTQLKRFSQLLRSRDALIQSSFTRMKRALYW